MGQPKAWLPCAGEPMLARVVRIVGQVVSTRVVVAAPGQDLPPLPADVMIARDEVEGRGPLQGLAAGLAALQGRVDAAYLSSCDVPFLLPGFVNRLIDLIGENSICVPFVDGFPQPLAALYRLDVLGAVRDLLAADRSGPTLLISAVPTRIVEASELIDVDPTLQSLRNLNTPAAYEAALREMVGL
jgi:molybdenum cofactor guanylyltransferase